MTRPKKRHRPSARPSQKGRNQISRGSAALRFLVDKWLDTIPPRNMTSEVCVDDERKAVRKLLAKVSDHDLFSDVLAAGVELATAREFESSDVDEDLFEACRSAARGAKPRDRALVEAASLYIDSARDGFSAQQRRFNARLRAGEISALDVEWAVEAALAAGDVTWLERLFLRLQDGPCSAARIAEAAQMEPWSRVATAVSPQITLDHLTSRSYLQLVCAFLHDGDTKAASLLSRYAERRLWQDEALPVLREMGPHVVAGVWKEHSTAYLVMLLFGAIAAETERIDEVFAVVTWMARTSYVQELNSSAFHEILREKSPERFTALIDELWSLEIPALALRAGVAHAPHEGDYPGDDEGRLTHALSRGDWNAAKLEIARLRSERAIVGPSTMAECMVLAIRAGDTDWLDDLGSAWSRARRTAMRDQHVRVHMITMLRYLSGEWDDSKPDKEQWEAPTDVLANLNDVRAELAKLVGGRLTLAIEQSHLREPRTAFQLFRFAVIHPDTDMSWQSLCGDDLDTMLVEMMSGMFCGSHTGSSPIWVELGGRDKTPFGVPFSTIERWPSSG